MTTKLGQAIQSDIRRRKELQRYLRDRTLETLADKHHCNPATIWNIERGKNSRMLLSTYREIQQARREYWEAMKEMERYRIAAIAARHGVHIATVFSHQQCVLVGYGYNQ